MKKEWKWEYLDKMNYKTKNNKRQRRALHNDKMITATTGYNNCKYICTQQGNTYIRQILKDIKVGNEINKEHFNTPLT